MRRLFYAFASAFALFGQVYADSDLKELINLEGYTVLDCTLEAVTPLSKYYPSHAHRLAKQEGKFSFLKICKCLQMDLQAATGAVMWPVLIFFFQKPAMSAV